MALRDSTVDALQSDAGLWTVFSTSQDDLLTNPFILPGVHAFIHSDNGPEFITEIVRN